VVGQGDRPAGDSAPWAAALDPAANLAALSRIQQRGLRAAGEIVDRLVATVDGERADAGGPTTSTSGDRVLGAADLDGLVDLWADVAKQFLHTVTGGGAPAGGGPSTEDLVLDVEGGAAARPVRLTPAGPSDELWLVNRSARDHAGLRLHVTELRSAGGAVLAAGVAFEPDVIESLPARSSRGVRVSVADPDPDPDSEGEGDGGAEPGVYRGLVLVDGLPDAWVPVEVTVPAPAPS
jgi:hypothetical protein